MNESIRHRFCLAVLILGCQASWGDPPTQSTAQFSPGLLNQVNEESRRIALEVQTTCANEAKVALPVVAGDVGAYRCIGPHDANFVAAQHAIQVMERQKELEEAMEAAARVIKLQEDYHQAQSECAKTGKAVLVTNTTPDGQQARFDCVSPDDPRYTAQHIAEVEQPPPPLTDLDSRLTVLVGRDVKFVVALMGGPQGEPIVNGNVVFTWSSFCHHLLPYTAIVNDRLTTSCDIKLATERKSGVIKSFEWKEQRGGCRIYADLLDKGSSP